MGLDVNKQLLLFGSSENLEFREELDAEWTLAKIVSNDSCVERPPSYIRQKSRQYPLNVEGKLNI